MVDTIFLKDRLLNYQDQIKEEEKKKWKEKIMYKKKKKTDKWG